MYNIIIIININNNMKKKKKRRIYKMDNNYNYVVKYYKIFRKKYDMQ